MNLSNVNERQLNNIRNDFDTNNQYQNMIGLKDITFRKSCDDADTVKAFQEICKSVSIDISNERFVYFLDFSYSMDINIGSRYGNSTPDYETLLNSGLSEMKYTKNHTHSQFVDDYNNTIDSIITLVGRVCDKLVEKKTDNYKSKLQWFKRMIDMPAKSFDEAVQRILFVNQIIWQSNHRLVGLGNIDELLSEFYKEETLVNPEYSSEAYSIICDMLKILHRDYNNKSNMLLGDTGQILVLGRSDECGDYVYNDLTLMFINAIKELQIPDPKVLLRVNKNTPDEVWKCAMECMATGVGTPLISNDDVIIDKLVKFGVPVSDAIHYTTAACWEPLIGGKSSSHNNFTTLNYLKGLDYTFKRENLDNIKCFEDLLDKYFDNLRRNLNAVIRVVKRTRYQYDPVFSVFIKGCKEKERDISLGGAKYSQAGITTVALSNVVNSLINIKKYVYEEKKYTLLDVKKLILTDYKDNEELPEILKNQAMRYGTDEDEVLELTNRITRFTTECTKDFRTYQGGKIKFGVSAPTYIDAAKGFDASFDGRRKNEPFGVHISNEKASSYTEVLNFASKLDYGENRFNGNVVDLMVSPSFIIDNIDKFTLMLKCAIEQGIFQLQINVVSSKTLIAARKNPSKYQGLIVRVWGFSAYFNDLPDDYKDLLIERAQKNEERAM